MTLSSGEALYIEVGDGLSYEEGEGQLILSYVNFYLYFPSDEFNSEACYESGLARNDYEEDSNSDEILVLIKKETEDEVQFRMSEENLVLIEFDTLELYKAIERSSVDFSLCV